MAEKLLVLVGAGASLMLGAPSTTQVTDAVRAIEQNLAIPIPDGLFRTNRVLEQLYQVLSQGYSAPNFETMLHALEVLQGLMAGWRPETGDRYRPVESILCGGPRGGRATSLFDGIAVSMAIDALYREVHELFASVSALAHTHTSWDQWKSFWTTLDQNFDLEVATLNYDSLVENAFPTGYFDEGFRPDSRSGAERFSPIHFSGGKRRLLHLHGSVHFGYDNRNRSFTDLMSNYEHEEVYRFSDPAAARRSWTGRSGNTSQAGRLARIGPLITGLDKTAKVFVAEPYRTYHHALHSLVERVPRLLVVGYGFGDLHVNANINHFWRLHGDDRRVAIIDYWDPWLPSSGWYRDRAGLFEAISRLGHDSMPMDDVERPEPWRSRDNRCLVTTLDLKDAAVNHMATLLAHLRY